MEGGREGGRVCHVESGTEDDDGGASETALKE